MAQSSSDQLTQIILDFINTDSWLESKFIIQQYPELLSDEADTLLHYLVEKEENKYIQKGLKAYQTFLQYCRESSVEAIFAEPNSGYPRILSQFQEEAFTAIKAREKYFQDYDPQALEQSISIWESIVTHPLFPLTPEKFQLLALSDTCNALSYRYSLKGQPNDLGQALVYIQEVVDRIPYDAPERLGYLNNLANILHDVYEQTGVLTDLERSIQLHREAVLLTHHDSPELARYLNNLANGLRDRYNTTGASTDLEQSIEAYRQAIDLTSQTSANMPMLLNNLGTALRDRYRRTGLIIDLDQSVAVLEQAIKLATKPSPYLCIYLSNLSNSLLDRHKRTQRLTDLTRAITVSTQAVKLTQENSPDLVIHLNNMANALSTRYKSEGNLEDLTQSIEIYRQTVNLALPDSPELPNFLNNLGNRLSDLYKLTLDITNLKAALESHHRTVALTLQNSSDLPSRLSNLANSLSNLYRRTKKSDDLATAIEKYHQACRIGLDVALEITLIASRNWGNWAIERQTWSEAAEAYGYGVEAIDRLYEIQSQRQAKENWLRDAQGLHANTAYAYAKTRQPAQAVSSLEHSRAFLLSENLERTRADLERLPDLGHANFYQNYQNALNQIWVLENQSQVDIDRLRAARTELDTIIGQIRQIEGYEDFLRLQPNFREDILATMTDKQIILVYTAVTHVGSVALIVQPSGTVTEVWLDDLTDKILREKIQGPDDEPDIGGFYAAYAQRRDNPAVWLQMMDNITYWLWSVLMGPLVEKIKSLPDANEINQVVLIPQGLLGLLPLHATWTEDATRPTGRLYALDEFLFTYSPNARALKASRERAAANPPDSIFVVDNPDQSLVFAEPEVTTALAYFPKNKQMRLTSENISFEKVTDCLSNYTIAHFATHGWANLTPLESSLSLGPNRAISLRSILNLRLQKVRLAILSACESAIPGRELPDEVVGLPTGLVQAGFAGVVGSLWEVPDRSTMMLMMRFYELWRGENLAPPEALRQAQIWLRDSSRLEKRQYFKGIGSQGGDKAAAAKMALNALLPPEAGNFQHPYHWAAFSYTGI